MEKRFAALRVIGTICKVLAWITLILGLLVAILLLIVGFTMRQPLGLIDLASRGPLVGIAGFVLVLTLALLLFLFMYGAGEFLYVFLSVEESDRRTAYILQQIYMAGQQPSSPLHEAPDR